ncbi:MAG: hypothetical protein KO202_04305 [Methanobacteriaceae archaeon]|nr:hypothetical protein [Methanobacteriaceae archaeon]
MSESQDNDNCEICYLCGKKFNINSDDGSYYRYKKYPICADCSNYYGFY